MELSPRVLLGLWVSVSIACSFDQKGLQTSTNTAGTLDSGAGETTDGGGDGSTGVATTVGSGDEHSGTIADEGSTSLPPATGTNADSGPLDTTATGGSSDAGSVGESSSSGAVSSAGSDGGSDGGVGPAPYSDCSTSDECGEGGTCVLIGMADLSGGHVCYGPCADDDDCPPGDGGDAIAFCTQSGCALDCEGHACPDGMECGWTIPSGYRRCAWP